MPKLDFPRYLPLKKVYFLVGHTVHFRVRSHYQWPRKGNLAYIMYHINQLNICLLLCLEHNVMLAGWWSKQYNQKNKKKQAEAEVVPSSSLVKVEVILLFRVGGWSGWISRR